MNKKLIVIMLLCIALPITNAVTPFTTFNSIPNYKDYVNVTVNSYNAVMPYGSGTLDLGSVAYFYIDTTFNASLRSTPIRYIEVAGFNSTGYFIGNITAYPYNNGLIIANKTINGKAYATATIFYNQITQFATYLDTQNIQITKDYLNINTLYLYGLTSAIGERTLFLNNNTNVTYQLSFNNTAVPYYLTANGNSQNISILRYLTTGITGQRYGYAFNGTSSKASLNATSYTTFTLNASQSRLFAYFNNNPNKPYIFASNGLAVPQNQIIQNLSTSFSAGGVFTAVSNYYFNVHLPKLAEIPYPNTYYFLPAFTTNITVVGNQIVTSPITLPNRTSTNLDCAGGWYYDFNYRIPITAVNWSYNFTTNADIHDIGNAVTLKYGAGAVGYLKLNLTHYTQMGTNCQNIFIEGYSAGFATPLGNVPFAVYSCNATTPTAQLILSNTTSNSFTYNTLYVYFDSRSNMSGFNSGVGWIISVSDHNYTVSLPSTPYLIELDKALTRNSILTFGTSGNYDKISTTAGNRYELYSFTPYNTKDVTDNTSQEILVASDTALYTKWLSTYWCNYPADPLCSIVGMTVVNTTTYWITGGNPPLTTLTANLTNNKIVIENLYTQNYTAEKYEYYVAGSCGLPNATNASVAYPLGNASSYPKLSGNFYYNVAHINATLTAQHLNGQVSFLGYFKMPEYAVVIITLIGTLITIGISLDEKPLMLVFIAFWILGIYNIGFDVLALVLTLVYGAYRFTHHHK